jgi:hypothetical protein
MSPGSLPYPTLPHEPDEKLLPFGGNRVPEGPVDEVPQRRLEAMIGNIRFYKDFSLIISIVICLLYNCMQISGRGAWRILDEIRSIFLCIWLSMGVILLCGQAKEGSCSTVHR